SGGDATLRFSAAGRTLNTRTVQVWINGTNVANREMSFFNILNADVVDNIPLSLISSNAANIEFRSSTVDTLPQFNRLVVGMYELNYPRLFNFGGQTNFEFVMPASAGGNNLVIDNFNFGGSVAPVLYDLTNGLRITASIVSATQVRVVLPPSSVERKLVLVSLDGGNIRAIQGVTPRNFTNYTLTTNQGDYIIISNPLLYSDASGVNQVEQYRLYRSSAAGGAHNAKIYDVGEIIDQFGYGIKNNAFAIKNFLRMAYDAFSVRPSNCFIIGKGVVYTNYRSSESTSKIDQLNLVPTFGNPASDTYLASAEGSIVQRIPIGRLTVVNGNEIKAYLDKVKKYESLYDANSCVVQDELWKKNVIHVAGANDLLGEQIRFHLNQYGNVLKDTSFGATIHSLQKSGVAAVQTIVSANITRLFQEGFSLLTYFGHSSPSTLEYNLSDPSSYPSIGKYPILLVNGCQAGNMFLSDETRLTGNYIITEKWVLTPEKGAVAFIASTHLGVVNYLHLYTEEFYNQMARPEQNAETIGRIMANVNDTLSRLYSYNDYYVRMHLEEITLHGDPALRFYNKKKPDYAVEPAMVKISPEFISIAESKFDVNVKLVNTGKAMSDSVHIRITRLYPDGKSSVQFDKNIKRLSYSDSILLELPIDPFRDKGSNKIRVEIDPDNLLDEECETNNVVTKEFFIFEDEIRPVYPYDYSIINKQNITYYASTANPLGATRKYYFEIDTTRNFNSVLLKKDSVISVGGSISFKPAGINFNDSTVYYWRVGMVPDGISAILWNDFSFVYIPGSESGFNQSHYFQHKQSSYKYMAINPGNRLMTFD
ncbi:MAG: hypothetical protein GXC73_19760, partial [Chitinophagaceae bacterium]|nr:hypothetical protein [Chitinophagaceae bacterium]